MQNVEKSRFNLKTLTWLKKKKKKPTSALNRNSDSNKISQYPRSTIVSNKIFTQLGVVHCKTRPFYPSLPVCAYNVTLQFFPTRGGNYFSSLGNGLPCDLLWPKERGCSNAVPALYWAWVKATWRRGVNPLRGWTTRKRAPSVRWPSSTKSVGQQARWKRLDEISRANTCISKPGCEQVDCLGDSEAHEQWWQFLF